MKRSPVALLGAALAAVALAVTSCSTPAPTASPSAGQTAKSSYKIGVTQIVTHASLDAAREGFKKAITASGLQVTYDEQNANGEASTATNIANKFKDANLDLILAIATPTAQSTSQVISDKPILFTAVTDPVAAKLVKSNEAPGGNVTGTTDMNPVAEQIALVKKLRPEAKTVGVIYSSGEVNSDVQVAVAKEAAAKEGLTLVEKTITNTSEVEQAAASLDVDAIYVPTDNNVVSGLGAVIKVAESKKIPLIAAEGDSVKNGAVITYGLDYEKLGYQTGEMAVRILKGEAKPETMPVEAQKDPKLYVNEAAAQRMGVTVPADLLSSATKVGS